MEDVLDQSFLQTNNANVKYAGFWQRFGALFLDGLILAPITFGLTYFNITTWKSPLLLVVFTILSASYKPFMEFMYGATWGKMALDLKVTNLQYNSASIQEILLRNSLHLVPQLISLFLTIGVYNHPDFEWISGYNEYTTFTQQFKGLMLISLLSGLVTIADAITLAADQRKRSLHDMLAGTYVISKD